MENILTYVKWRKDILFEERGFNDVDALIFAVLSYVEWEGYVKDHAIPLKSAAQMFSKSEDRINDYKRYAYSIEIPKLVEILNDAPRYNDVLIKKYKTVFDKQEEVQFAAVTFELPDGTHVISYRGTDSSILGWREDFRMTYKEEIPAQRYALAYLKEVMPEKKKKGFFSFHTPKESEVYLVGHSKGGNLAMYSAIKATELQDQITRVYNFDGPGFLPSFYEQNEMSSILPKIKLYLPSSSIIGRLLEHKEEAVIIEGYESGLMQHSAFRWQVKADGFIKAEKLSKQSDDTIEYIDHVLLAKTDAQKQMLIDAVFNTLENMNIDEISNLGELNLKQGIEGLKEFGLMSNEDKRFFMDCLRFILTQTKNMILSRTEKVKR